MNEQAKYAVMTTKTENVAKTLNLNLGLKLNGRESSCFGYHFLYSDLYGSEVQIYQNKDPLWRAELDIPEEEFFEHEHKAFEVLILCTLPSELQIKLLKLLQQHFPKSIQIGNGTKA